MLTYKWCPRDEFIKNISEEKGDKFAKTFIAKADMIGGWPYCFGAYDEEGNLLAAIITTISKRKPHTANLQLLHTFFKHRGRGAARFLCENALRSVSGTHAEYFRVSSEIDAIGFYEKIGFKFWGKQKSGCQLSIFRIGGPLITDAIYDYNDTVIFNAINTKMKGGCVELFPMCALNDLSEFL